MSNIEYLYRYTSLESLALILKSRQIRLNPLDKMDDLQEQKTADVENLGKFVFNNGHSLIILPEVSIRTPFLFLELYVEKSCSAKNNEWLKQRWGVADSLSANSYNRK